jgi:uncharacterized RDD family membrane protein YckC
MSDTSFLAPESPGATTAPSDDYAGFWIRFGASFLDGIVLLLVSGILEATLKTTGSALGLLVNIGYFTYFEGSSGQTLGKQACNIRVVDDQGGAPIGYSRAFLRWIGRIISTIPILLGYFWMLWDGRRQCWHDKIANDVVVRV